MTVHQLTLNKRVQIPATAATIGLMLLLPFLVHLIGGPTAGGRWLPLFYAPVAAAILFQPGVALTAGLLTPFLNHFLTGSPPLPMSFLLSFELVVFVLIVQGLYRRWPTLGWMAPLAYILTKTVELLALTLLPDSLLPVLPWPFFSTSLTNAWPGVLVLLLINWLTVKGVQRGP